MTGINVGSILAGLTSDKTYNSFVRIGFVDANGVRVPVGGAEGWGACDGGDELFDTCYLCSCIVPIKIACVCLLNKFGVDECDGRRAFCPIKCHDLVAFILIRNV